MPETRHEVFSPTMVEEMACESCKVPDIYFNLRGCNRGKGHVKVKTGRKVPKFYASKTFLENPVRRMIGYEVEVSGYRDGRATSDFIGSIGGGVVTDCAMEMNIPPANGDELVKLIKNVSEKIRSYGCVAKSHPMAGLHTHVDCRDASYNDIRKIMILYGKTEGALYSIIDPRRIRNGGNTSWSKPVGGEALVDMMSDPMTAKVNIQKFVGLKPGQRITHADKNPPAGGDRYLGFNLWSWWVRGTIEFRMHHGTTHWDKMLYWGMLLGGMVETAINKGDAEIMNWPVGKEGMLAYAPTQACKDWASKRWDYFASKRKNPDQPIF